MTLELVHDDSKLQVTESLDESKGEGGVGGEVSIRIFQKANV